MLISREIEKKENERDRRKGIQNKRKKECHDLSVKFEREQDDILAKETDEFHGGVIVGEKKKKKKRTRWR